MACFQDASGTALQNVIENTQAQAEVHSLHVSSWLRVESHMPIADPKAYVLRI